MKRISGIMGMITCLVSIVIITTVLTENKDYKANFFSNQYESGRESNIEESNSDAIENKDITDKTEPVETELDRKYSTISDFKCVKQNPELPTGCEVTSLTAVLNYYGYKENKVNLARNYLECGDGDFWYMYLGNPETDEGYGCMAQPIVKAANKFLDEKKSSLRAYNVSGMSLIEMEDYINVGIPIIIWNTIYMKEVSRYEEMNFGGYSKVWKSPEHCVVLTGYNNEKNIAYVSDPLCGNVERVLDDFYGLYMEMNAQAVIIK